MPMYVVELCHTWLYAGCDCSMYFVTTSASACTYMHMYVHAQHLMIGFKLKSIIKAKQFSSSVFLLEHFLHFYRRTELLLSSLIGLSPITLDDASHLTATLRYVSRLTPASVARVQLLSCIHTAYYNGKSWEEVRLRIHSLSCIRSTSRLDGAINGATVLPIALDYNFNNSLHTQYCIQSGDWNM